MDMENSAWERTLQEAMKLWVIPEIERRKKTGRLPANFNLSRAQIIFGSPIDKSGVKVRLNDEVKALTKVKLNRKIKEGEIIYLKDIKDIEQIELTDEEKDFAHFTMMRSRDNWVVAFDFRYNRQRARRHIEIARQFLELARFSQKKKFYSAFVDTLFSAAELLAKSQLLLMPYAKLRSHSRIQSLYSLHARLGNVKLDYKDAMCKLSGLRDSARYLKSAFKLKDEEALVYLQTVEEVLDYCLKVLEPDAG